MEQLSRTARFWHWWAALSLRRPVLIVLLGTLAFVASVPFAARLYGDLRTRRAALADREGESAPGRSRRGNRETAGRQPRRGRRPHQGGIRAPGPLSGRLPRGRRRPYPGDAAVASRRGGQPGRRSVDLQRGRQQGEGAESEELPSQHRDRRSEEHTSELQSRL